MELGFIYSVVRMISTIGTQSQEEFIFFRAFFIIGYLIQGRYSGNKNKISYKLMA
ncbi:hypothetical protein PROVRUST_04530 [Providencia rustigianii DSM 4541]|uniref:Uncharacterized protein n=1 Tax=Providencia rustigianii DSM 4541 TaxID=500637 RepID=D1NXA2_9GAMM|nr:hypothetical protein PROVRUST_04530 [Providencia rustigianii DSM 4541]